MSDIKIITNNQERPLVYYWELTDAEKEEFDYTEEYDTFFRYKGQLYVLCDFMRVEGNFGPFKGWQGYIADSYSSGILVRYADDPDYVITGSYYS